MPEILYQGEATTFAITFYSHKVPSALSFQGKKTLLVLLLEIVPEKMNVYTFLWQVFKSGGWKCGKSSYQHNYQRVTAEQLPALSIGMQ